MVKKLVLLLLLAVPLVSFAQDKIAYINTQEVFYSMPEMEGVNKELQALITEKQKVLGELDADLQKFGEEADKQRESLSDAELQAKFAEFQKKQTAVEEYAENSRKEIQEKEESLMAPLRQKFQQAIKDVGDENSFTYILEVSTLPYIGRSATDATPLLKAKLNIPLTAAPTAPAR